MYPGDANSYVRRMGMPTLQMACFLVEWYRPELVNDRFEAALVSLGRSAASLSAEGTRVELLLTLTVPSDEVVFGVMAAESADIVATVCRRAGVPAERVTAAINIRPGGGASGT